MYLTDDEIIACIKEYVEEDKYFQAIMIDGKWGSGKTYFVNKKLLRDSEEVFGSKNVIYVSLYGIDNTEQVLKEVYFSMFEETIDKTIRKESIGEKVKKGANILGKLITTGAKHFNIELNDLLSDENLIKLKNLVIIFDDLERCHIEINKLLGFINNLVEHNEIKAILIANQSEIGKNEIANDLALKYLVALDSRIGLEGESLKSKQENKDSFNILEVDKRMKEIFPEDDLYKKLKEKLIGYTIEYRVNLKNVYNEIVNEYIQEENVKDYLIKNKNDVIKYFEEENHYNLRTLIFIIISYKKLFTILDELFHTEGEYLEDQKYKVLMYTTLSSIYIKSGKDLYNWENKTNKSGFINNGTSIFKGIYGYKFVDDYLLYRKMDLDEIECTIKEIIVELKVNDVHLSLNKANREQWEKCSLEYWWELEDEEIIKRLSIIQDLLIKKELDPKYFKAIIISLMQLKERYFDCDKSIEEYVYLMGEKLKENNKSSYKRTIEFMSTDKEAIEKYKGYAKPLLDILDDIERNEKKDRNSFLNDGIWNDEFIKKCRENHDAYCSDKKFFFYFDITTLKQRLEKSKTIEIIDFERGIEQVYSFANLNDFFKNDIPNLKMIRSFLDDIESLSKGSFTKKIALEHLKVEIDKYIKVIENKEEY